MRAEIAHKKSTMLLKVIVADKYSIQLKGGYCRLREIAPVVSGSQGRDFVRIRFRARVVNSQICALLNKQAAQMTTSS